MANRHQYNSDNYDINDLDDGDETDDESTPRKRVPLWAEGKWSYLP